MRQVTLSLSKVSMPRSTALMISALLFSNASCSCSVQRKVVSGLRRWRKGSMQWVLEKA